MKISTLKIGLPVFAGVLLSACGGGGYGSSASSSASSGDSTSAASVSSSSSSVASAAALVSGTITGFGSVHVNGIHFETEHATILKDDQPITQQELRVGQMVRVRGHVDDTTGQGVADSISFDNNVEGAITSIDAANSSFVVLGQTVHVDASTSFDDSMSVPSLAGLKVGDRVEVSGLVNAAGEIVASRIELGGASSGVELIGAIAALDSAAHTFKIGTQSVDYSAAQLKDFSTAGPANGNAVEVHGTLSSSNILVATRVELQTGDDNVANSEHEVEGLVTRFVSATDFDVAGKKVTTSSATRYVNGVLADLKLDARVEVEGKLNNAGALVADKVEFRIASEVRLQAKIDAVDAGNNQVTLLGIVIKTNSITRFEDKSSLKVERFSLANVVVGDYVEIRAGLSNGALTATRLEREPTKSEVQVRATVTAVNAPQFTVLGVVVTTNGTTQFEDHGSHVTATQFFAAANGQPVTVIGTVSGTAFTASKVELHSNDD